jgi:hypothetical protein
VGASSGTSTQLETYELGAPRARFVRYYGFGALSNTGGTTSWNSLTEVRIFAVP